MPIGIAVTHASAKAAKTRNRLQPKCSASGRPPWISPFHASAKLATMRSGVGRNRSRIQPLCVATHHSTRSTMTVTAAMSVLEPSPGTLYPLTRRIGADACTGASVSRDVAAGSVSGAFIVLRSFLRRWRRMDQVQHFLAQADERGIGFHDPRIVAFDEAPPEIDAIAMRDAARRRQIGRASGRESAQLSSL